MAARGRGEDGDGGDDGPRRSTRYDRSEANVAARKEKKARARFLHRMYLEILLMEAFFTAYAVGIDFSLGKRWRHESTFREEANSALSIPTQFFIFVLFYLFSSITVFKARQKRTGGLSTVDLLLFGVCFAIGALQIVFTYYPCKVDYWDANIACISLTLVNLLVTTALILTRRDCFPGAYFWLLVTVIVGLLDAGLYFLFCFLEFTYFSPVHFIDGIVGAAFCHLALIISTSTIMRHQTKRLLTKTNKVLGRQEPYVFANFHTVLCLMFIQVNFAMAFHYKHLFYNWYNEREFNVSGGSYCEKEDEKTWSNCGKLLSPDREII